MIMSIAVTPRKGLLARRIAREQPELSASEVAKLVGTNGGYVIKAISKSTFGRDKPKSRIRS